MEATSILSPSERCVRSKLQLFMRLWVTRQRYENLRPYGSTCAERIGFHLRQLDACWTRIVEFQKVLGLDVALFHPRDQFEQVYVVSAFVDRELANPENSLLDFAPAWRSYQQALGHLSHELNPFEFGETCTRIHRVIRSLTNPETEPAELIRLEERDLARLHGMGQGTLSMKITN